MFSISRSTYRGSGAASLGSGGPGGRGERGVRRLPGDGLRRAVYYGADLGANTFLFVLLRLHYLTRFAVWRV